MATVGHRYYGEGCPYCNKILLKDGATCDSLPEAYKYLEYKKMGLIFEHNKRYHKDFGKFKYDFYFPNKNKYVEVTSYHKNSLKSFPGRYFRYLRNIIIKRRFVEDILGAKFEFIQFVPSRHQIEIVNKNRKMTC